MEPSRDRWYFRQPGLPSALRVFVNLLVVHSSYIASSNHSPTGLRGDREVSQSFFLLLFSLFSAG